MKAERPRSVLVRGLWNTHTMDLVLGKFEKLYIAKVCYLNR